MDKRVVDFIKEFFRIEKECVRLRRKKDLDSYNKELGLLQELVIEELKTKLGFLPKSEPEDEEFYELIEFEPSPIPRYLFKISKYEQKVFGDVWVAYSSLKNPVNSGKRLAYAFWIQEVEGVLRITDNYLYTSYSSDGKEYRWEKVFGKELMSFEEMIGPVEILRIQEPDDEFDGLELYNEEM